MCNCYSYNGIVWYNDCCPCCLYDNYTENGLSIRTILIKP